MRKLIVLILSILLLSLIPFPNFIYAEDKQSIKNDIIYDILIDRFNNGRQAKSEQVDVNDPLTYNGGDIKGITLMLDTIEEHGFTAISLSPLMKNAERGYHGYWIEDFYEVEEEFGSLEDLQELISEAHSRNIKVYLELVINYVAASSPLVQEKEQENWFKEVEATPIDATEWLYDVVQFNQENEDVQQFLIDVASYWSDATDLDGYVIHAADQADDTFLQLLTDEIKSMNPELAIIAKSLQGGSLDHLCSHEQIDLIANDSLMEEIQDVFSHVDEPVSRLFEVTQSAPCDNMLLFADNKNTARFSNITADEGRNAITTWTLALTYLYLTPGVPIIYQGSEVPMYGPGFIESQYMVDAISADPDLKKVFERLSSTRDMFSPLVHGDFEQIATEKGFSLFKRTDDGQVVYIGINNDSESRFVHIDDLPEDLQLRGLFHDDTVRADDDGKFKVGLARETAEVFIVQPREGFNWVFISAVLSVMLIFIIGVIYLSVKQKRRENK